MSPTPERQARQQIDEALEAAGWVIQDRAKMNLAAATGVAVCEFRMAPGHGFADYLLFVHGKAVGVVEAKPAGYALTNVELQSRQIRNRPPCRAQSSCRPAPVPVPPGGTTAWLRRLHDAMRSLPSFTIGSRERESAVADPACGTGGFLLAAHEYLKNHFELDRDQKRHLRFEALRGVELVPNVARLCGMNLVLHGIGPGGRDDHVPPIETSVSPPLRNNHA